MGRKFALIIGNSDYQDPALTRLKAPEADVQTLAEILRDPDIGAFDDVQVSTNAIEADVRRTISRFFSEKKREDLLLLYFSGHGVLDENGRLHLAVKDTERNLLAATSIPATFINERMDECRSRRKILILDCCHSGAWEVGTKGDTPAVTADTFQGYGRVVMTASDKTQYALEGDQVVEDVSLSLFTNYLVEGLKTGKADKDEDGQVDVDEWYDYAREQVISQTTKQKPKIWMFDTEGDLVVARSPKPVSLPAELNLAIQSPFVAVRADAVEELKRILQGNNPGLVVAAHRALQELAAHDDSKRIASAASAALTTFDPLWHLRAPGESPLAEPSVDERLAIEKAAAERQAAEKAEAERLAAEKAEAERIAREKAEAEHIAREKAEAERLAAEQAEAERQAREKDEAERRAAEQAEADRLARQRLEAERRAREEAEAERQRQRPQDVTYLPFSSELRPQRFNAGETAEVLIDVPEQAPDYLTVDFSDPKGNLVFTPPHAQVSVQSGYDASVKFRATLRQPPLVALSSNYPFQARIAAPTGEAQTITGEVLARPRLPIWIIPVALVLILACLGGATALYSSIVQGARRQQAVQTDSSEQTQAAAVLSLYQTGTAQAAVAVIKTSPAPQNVVATEAPGLPTHTPEQHLQETPTPPPPTTVVKWVVFGSNRDGNWEIYLMQDDEVHLTRLTDNPAEDTFPVFSPDGTKIAFHSDRKGNFDIYVMDSDGTDLTPLTDNPRADTFPAWSPDGTKIVFQSKRDGNKQIYVMNADGSNETRLTHDSVDDVNPSWSPDGRYIVYSSVTGGGIQIYMMNADGSNPRQLTSGSQLFNFPVWSPDGQWLAYDNSTQGIERLAKVTIDASGNIGKEIFLTDSAYDATHPRWSMDGYYLFFTSQIDGNMNLYRMNSDGTNIVQLTFNPADDAAPSVFISSP
jgi:Tol biopolymer transport system component